VVVLLAVDVAADGPDVELTAQVRVIAPAGSAGLGRVMLAAVADHNRAGLLHQAPWSVLS
jgi:hypothetical protein